MIKKVNILSVIKVMTDEMFMITKRQVMLTCRLCYRSQLSREARMWKKTKGSGRDESLNLNENKREGKSIKRHRCIEVSPDWDPLQCKVNI